MRKTLLFVFLLVIGTGAYGNVETDQKQTLAISLVLDISPSVKKYASNIKSIRGQLFSCLKAGDYLEIITAHHDSSQLRLAQFIKSADTDEIKTIDAILSTISYAGFLDSDVARAFYMAYNRLEGLSSQHHFGKCIIIILTDGRCNDSEAERINYTARRCRFRNFKVILTGTSNTNRHILTTAAMGDDFKWSLLSEAHPALWVAEARNSIAVDHVEAKPPKVTTPPQISPEEKSKPDDKPALKESKAATLPNEQPPQLTPDQKPKIPLTTPPKETGPPEPKKQNSLQPVVSKQKTIVPSQKPSKPIRSFLPWLWLLVIPVAIFFSIVITRNFKDYKNWRAKLQARLPKIQKCRNAEILMAKYNDRTFRLGALTRLRSIHIGSGSGNSVKITDDSVAERHLKIYRRRHRLMICNLAPISIFVNHKEVKPGHKHPLIIPSVLQLSEKVKLELAINQKQTHMAAIILGGNNHEANKRK